MKIFQTLVTAFAATILFATVAQAQIGRGTVKCFSAKGDVQLINIKTGESKALVEGMEFRDHSMIVTGADSSALILFSNASVVNVAPDTTMRLDEFLQADYNPDRGTIYNLEEEPTVSKTSIFIEAGEIVGEVHTLVEGSSYTLSTPYASAEVVGTIYKVAVDMKNGKVSMGTSSGQLGKFKPGTELPKAIAEQFIESLTSAKSIDSNGKNPTGEALTVSLETNENGTTSLQVGTETVALSTEAQTALTQGLAAIEAQQEPAISNDDTPDTKTSEDQERGPGQSVDVDIIPEDTISGSSNDQG